MTFEPYIINGGMLIVVLGIVRVMINGKQNKGECELITKNFANTVKEIKDDGTKTRDAVQKMAISIGKIEENINGK